MAVRSTMNTVVFNEVGDNLYVIELSSRTNKA
jgi:hypothetical protein